MLFGSDFLAFLFLESGIIYINNFDNFSEIKLVKSTSARAINGLIQEWAGEMKLSDDFNYAIKTFRSPNTT